MKTYGYSTYPGEHKLVHFHPTNEGADWYNRDEVEQIVDWQQSQLTLAQAQIVQLRECVKALKIRIAFIGMPQESMWNQRPDWRKEVALIEATQSSTPPPPVVPKEVADEVYNELSLLKQNGHLNVDVGWINDIKKALTAYEQATKQ